MSEGLYSLAHPQWFETIERFAFRPRYASVLQEILPSGWSLERHTMWLGAKNGRPIPRQGFKIHVSTIQKHAISVLRTVATACFERDVTFKVAGDHQMLHQLNSRSFPRGNAGKFMTIYPPSDDIFLTLIEELYQRTRTTGAVGPYVLSDRRYKDSSILSYRYGGFQAMRRLDIDGTRPAHIETPTGEVVRDSRLPFFVLPNWVTDPFPVEASTVDADTPLGGGRYRVESAIKFSNSGGVYYATDLETGNPVVIKEARPLTNEWNFGGSFVDARALLNWEWRVLNRLKHLGCVPRPVQLFQEWEHTFLVEEFINLPTFWHFWANPDNIFAPYVRRPGAIERFVPKLARLGLAILDALEDIHGAGVILGDLSTRNVLVDPETLRVRIIDFESAIVSSDSSDRGLTDYGRNWHTPGFLHPKRAERGTATADDDFYSLGMLLYCAVVPAQEFFQLHPVARDRFLDGMVALGVSEVVRDIIRCLWAGDAAQARKLLITVAPPLPVVEQ